MGLGSAHAQTATPPSKQAATQMTRGTGAHGVFVASQDISKYTRAAVFTPGQQTPVFVRFSSVIY